MDPASALPSYRVYRGSLVALLVGSIFAVWLLVRPGGEADADGPPAALAAVLPTSTPTPRPQTTATPQRTATATPTGTAAPGTPPPSTPTPAPPPPTPTATPAQQTHTVASGDTLTSIAERYKPANVGIGDYLQRIYQLNNMTEFSTLSIGQTIRIPPG